MRKGDLANDGRVRRDGGVRTGFVCKSCLPARPFEQCSADTTVYLVDVTTFGLLYQGLRPKIYPNAGCQRSRKRSL